MDYFRQYEIIKKLRKHVPINSIWRNPNSNFNQYRYKPIEIYLSNTGKVYIKYEMTDIDDPSWSYPGNCAYVVFTKELEMLM